MIRIYSPFTDSFDGNGSAILRPISCTVTEEAGGNYQLSMSHPVDAHGVWKTIQPGCIIKAPVPALTTGITVRSGSVDIYMVNHETPIRAKPEAPRSISYAAWVKPTSQDEWYHTGDKVTYNGANYQCNASITAWQQFEAPAGNSGWTTISPTKEGAAVLQNLMMGDRVYWTSAYSDEWARVASMKGVEGYILRQYIEFQETIQVDPTDARTITSQLFRVQEVSVDNTAMTVTVTAPHVSYDLSGNLLTDCVITKQAPATALALIRAALMTEYTNAMATDLTTEQDGTYSADLSKQNGVHALLDPDSGFVAFYKAKLIRDNWDFFIYRNEKTDRGLRLERGKNLRGVKWTQSSDGLITRIMPVAKKADGDPLYLFNQYVDSPMLSAYPVIRTEILSIDIKVGDEDEYGGTWSEDQLKEHMLETAMKRYDVDNCDKIKNEITVQFTLLGDTEEYRQYKGLQKLYLYDTVTVRDSVIGLDQQLQVSKVTYDCVNERYDSITLGDVFEYGIRAVAGYELRNGSININKLSDAAIAKLKG